MRQFLWLPLPLVVFMGCHRSQPPVPVATDSSAGIAEAPPELVEQPATRSGDLVIADPVRHENLVVFPVLSDTTRDDDRFTTLDEGLKAGTVEVSEVGAAGGRGNGTASDDDGDPFVEHQVMGDVNHLMVLNKSDRPLYLMPGEIIVGGRQDRCIAAETIVEPSDEPVSVDVYCVEHGRWHGRRPSEFASIASGLFEFSEDGAELTTLSERAAKGEFVVSAGNLNKKARFITQAGKSQHEVWDEVANANAIGGISLETAAFTGNYSKERVEKLQPYIESLKEPVAAADNVVGVIVAINGKVEMADVFESTPLFLKLWPKLLKGYALDASVVGDADDADELCTVEAAKEFLDGARDADVEKTQTKGGLLITSRSTKDVESFSAGMGGMGAGFGGAVHSAAASK
jgi:hypothetical protein